MWAARQAANTYLLAGLPGPPLFVLRQVNPQSPPSSREEAHSCWKVSQTSFPYSSGMAWLVARWNSLHLSPGLGRMGVPLMKEAGNRSQRNIPKKGVQSIRSYCKCDGCRRGFAEDHTKEWVLQQFYEVWLGTGNKGSLTLGGMEPCPAGLLGNMHFKRDSPHVLLCSSQWWRTCVGEARLSPVLCYLPQASHTVILVAPRAEQCISETRADDRARRGCVSYLDVTELGFYLLALVKKIVTFLQLTKHISCSTVFTYS